MAFADPEAREAKELMVRLLREKTAYEANVFPDNNFIVSASVFPYFYGLVGDRNPRQAPKSGSRSEYSPLAVDAFRLIQKEGPISKYRLRELLGGDISEAALDRALDELWARLRITRVDYKPDEGVFWDVLFRWSPDAVKEGMHVSVAESLTALVSKYLDCVLAAPQEEVEQFFSHLIGRARVREAINALQAARELSFVHVNGRVMLQVTSLQAPPPPHEFKPRPKFEALPPRPGNAAGGAAAATLGLLRTTETSPAGQQQRMSAPRKLVIAIDGPAGSGKSTIAARLAKKLGYTNLESGAMYRAMALKAMEQQVALDDAEALRQLAQNSVIELEPRGEGNRVLLDGRDVSQRIREADVTLAASQVSVHPPVRQVMVARQRELGANGGVVMEGRDIGTAVFPNAEVKIFLDADPTVRAERRVLQNGSQVGRRSAAGAGGDRRPRPARPDTGDLAAGARVGCDRHRYHAQGASTRWCRRWMEWWSRG